MGILLTLLCAGGGAVVCGALYVFWLSKRGTARPASLPATMKVGLLLKFVEAHSSTPSDYDGCFELADREVPVPRNGEVLVRIERSPINPSDLSTLKGTYNSAQREELPCMMGFEASGVVVQSGGGVMAGMLHGKRVGVVTVGGGKFWAQYAVVSALKCVVLPDDVTFEEGCGCFVNPLTALSFFEIAEGLNRRSMLHTAAASALGRMVLKLGLKTGIDVICVVRRDAQAAELRRIGAKNELATLCKELDCKLAFDAVAGELTGHILEAMPKGSEVRVYGGLSMEGCRSIRPTDLIFLDKRVQGFWLTQYLGSKSMYGQWRWTKRLQSLLKSTLATHVRTSFPLGAIQDALATYNGDMSAGKVCIAPNMSE